MFEKIKKFLTNKEMHGKKKFVMELFGLESDSEKEGELLKENDDSNVEKSF